MIERRDTESTAVASSECSTLTPRFLSNEKAQTDPVEDKASNGLATAVGQEPPRTVELEGIRVVGLQKDDEEFYRNFSEEFRKRVFNKIDWRLLPVLSMLYLIAHIDRSNIGNAKIEGLERDLNLTSVQWSLVLCVFFIPYMVLEVPSNMIIKHFQRPSRYLGLLVIGWGVVMIGHTFVQTFAGLMAVRACLGVFEAGFFPGAIYLLTSWYMPQQLATRITFFHVTGGVSGVFSGLLAASIAQLDGRCGLAGWRWIFLIDAITTILLGILCVFFLVDSPGTSQRWLNADEIRFLELQKFIKEGGKCSQEDSRRAPRNKFKDSMTELSGVLGHWRLYLQAFVMICAGTNAWGIKVTLPTITKAMGFSNAEAQLMSCPPYIGAAIVGLAFAYLSDRQYRRLPFILAALAITTLALIIMNAGHGDVARNIPLFMTAVVMAFMGFAPLLPLMTSWVSGNLAPTGRKAVGLAFVNTLAGTSGITGSFLFQGGPDTYRRSFAIGLGLMLGAMISAAAAGWSYKWANDNKARMSEEQIRDMYTEDQLLAMGDKSPLWKYHL